MINSVFNCSFSRGFGGGGVVFLCIDQDQPKAGNGETTG